MSDKRIETIKDLADAAGVVIQRYSAQLEMQDDKVTAAPPRGIILSTFLEQIKNNGKCSNTDGRGESLAINTDEAIYCTDLTLDEGFIKARIPNASQATEQMSQESIFAQKYTYKDKGSEQFTADIVVSGPTPGAVKAESLKMPYPSQSLLYSACRTIHIKVRNKNSAIVSEASLSGPDPNWVEFTRFPDKGKIVIGPRCGADSVAEDYSLPGATQYINSMIDAGKTIKDALDKKKVVELSSLCAEV